MTNLALKPLLLSLRSLQALQANLQLQKQILQKQILDDLQKAGKQLYEHFGAACVLIMALENGFSSRRKESTLRCLLRFLAIDFAIASQLLCMQLVMALRLRKRSTTGGS